jgi:hypothetical protein
MHLPPQGDEFIEVLGSYIQDAAYRTAFRVRWADSVWPVAQPYSSVVSQIDNHLGLLKKSVDVPGRVVLRICHEQHAAESKRSHHLKINLSWLGLYTSIYDIVEFGNPPMVEAHPS